MKISAITPFSLIEFPWEVSCIVFTPWCNMRCWFCHNSEFVLPEKIRKIQQTFISLEVFFRFLTSRKHLLSWVSICWWEPTIQWGLEDFCEKIHNIGLKVKLDTNGTNPHIIEKLLWKKCIDYIAMDIKHEIHQLPELIGVNIQKKLYKKSIEIIKNSGIDYEFRTTIIWWVHSINSIESLSREIEGAKKYVLQSYKSGNTLNPNFFWYSYSQDTLMQFKKIAEKYVKTVIIRF